jgi:PAS domain S-box-containing protein
VNSANGGLRGPPQQQALRKMQAQPERSADEIKGLQCCINDLVSVLALPAMWSGREPSHILHTLLETLAGMLRLDLICAQLNECVGELPVELIRIVESGKPVPAPKEICESVRRRLRDAPNRRSIPNPKGTGDISIVQLPLGLQGEIGMVVVGAQRADFPRETERLVLSVAANQAAIGLQEARLLSEQKRLASILDERVAERTKELAEANEELRKEIAERKQVEEKLRWEERELKRSEGHKAAILDSSLDCVIGVDHEGRITEFNLAAERTLGYSQSNVVGKNLADVIIPASLRQKHQTGFARYAATGESRVLGRRVEMTALCADGREIPVELAITRIPQEGPPSFTGYLRDITERKRNEDALHEAHAEVARSEERWRSVFENSAVGVALTDLDGRFLATNPVYQKMLGYTGEELQRLSFADVTHEDYREDNWKLTTELLDGARREFQIEKQYRRKDGSLVWVRNHVSIVPGTGRMPRFFMAIGEDITDHKGLNQARAELAKVTRITSLGVLTASIAHEVSQPLAGIVTNANTCGRMLAANPPNIEGARETTRRTLRDGNRASEIINRLRALFARKEFTLEPLDLTEVTREVMTLTLSDLQRNRVILRSEFDEMLPLISGDRVQLQQVILNLLRNASDAMSQIEDRPRELLIRTAIYEEDRVCLIVRDAGVGFDPQAVERLFEAFYTTKDDGMGIGLSVSHSIIERHQGHLWASLNHGPGATFSFSIPCGPARAKEYSVSDPIPSSTVTDIHHVVRNL